MLLIAVPALESCKQSVATSARNHVEPEEAEAPSESPKMYAVLYQQRAAEYRALCYQAFNVAKYQLEKRVKEKKGAKKLSVVVDIDETMLDNSPYEARNIVQGKSYPEGWDEWVKEGSAEAVPGAIDFMIFAKSLGVEVFYVSNRKEKNFDITLKNLQKLGFPFAQGDHLFLKRDTSSKKARRERVEEHTEIVMLIGDNLADFSEIYENAGMQERKDITDRFSEKFGSKFIVLPNASYGDWINVIEGTGPSDTPELKAEHRRNALITQ